MSFIKGILWLFFIPTFVMTVAFLFVYLLPSFGIFLLPPIAIIIIVAYPLAFHIVALYLKVPYSDLDVLDRVMIPQAPKEIERMLKTRTRGTNRLVNVEIISSLGEKTLVQSRLVERVQKRGIDLTQTRIIECLSYLRRLDIVYSYKGQYTRQWAPTEKGKWCYKAVRQCFPKRQFWFIVRHYLGYKTLPPFPETTKE